MAKHESKLKIFCTQLSYWFCITNAADKCVLVTNEDECWATCK